MASVHQASCPCGYNEIITIGGTRAGRHELTTFPYYCQQCGLVSANIADVVGLKISTNFREKWGDFFELPSCPECGNKNIDQYGVPPASSAPSVDELVVLQVFHFKAYRTGNLCPACKQMTLVFMSAHIFAD